MFVISCPPDLNVILFLLFCAHQWGKRGRRLGDMSWRDHYLWGIWMLGALYIQLWCQYWNFLGIFEFMGCVCSKALGKRFTFSVSLHLYRVLFIVANYFSLTWRDWLFVSFGSIDQIVEENFLLVCLGVQISWPHAHFLFRELFCNLDKSDLSPQIELYICYFMDQD